jgi:hypothetical protein
MVIFLNPFKKKKVTDDDGSSSEELEEDVVEESRSSLSQCNSTKKSISPLEDSDKNGKVQGSFFRNSKKKQQQSELKEDEDKLSASFSSEDEDLLDRSSRDRRNRSPNKKSSKSPARSSRVRPGLDRHGADSTMAVFQGTQGSPPRPGLTRDKEQKNKMESTMAVVAWKQATNRPVLNSHENMESSMEVARRKQLAKRRMPARCISGDSTFAVAGDDFLSDEEEDGGKSGKKKRRAGKKTDRGRNMSKREEESIATAKKDSMKQKNINENELPPKPMSSRSKNGADESPTKSKSPSGTSRDSRRKDPAKITESSDEKAIPKYEAAHSPKKSKSPCSSNRVSRKDQRNNDAQFLSKVGKQEDKADSRKANKSSKERISRKDRATRAKQKVSPTAAFARTRSSSLSDLYRNNARDMKRSKDNNKKDAGEDLSPKRVVLARTRSSSLSDLNRRRDDTGQPDAAPFYDWGAASKKGVTTQTKAVDTAWRSRGDGAFSSNNSQKEKEQKRTKQLAFARTRSSSLSDLNRKKDREPNASPCYNWSAASKKDMTVHPKSPDCAALKACDDGTASNYDCLKDGEQKRKGTTKDSPTKQLAFARTRSSSLSDLNRKRDKANDSGDTLFYNWVAASKKEKKTSAKAAENARQVSDSGSRYPCSSISSQKYKFGAFGALLGSQDITDTTMIRSALLSRTRSQRPAMVEVASAAPPFLKRDDTTNNDSFASLSFDIDGTGSRVDAEATFATDFIGQSRAAIEKLTARKKMLKDRLQKREKQQQIPDVDADSKDSLSLKNRSSSYELRSLAAAGDQRVDSSGVFMNLSDCLDSKSAAKASATTKGYQNKDHTIIPLRALTPRMQAWMKKFHGLGGRAAAATTSMAAERSATERNRRTSASEIYNISGIDLDVVDLDGRDANTVEKKKESGSKAPFDGPSEQAIQPQQQACFSWTKYRAKEVGEDSNAGGTVEEHVEFKSSNTKNQNGKKKKSTKSTTTTEDQPDDETVDTQDSSPSDLDGEENASATSKKASKTPGSSKDKISREKANRNQEKGSTKSTTHPRTEGKGSVAVEDCYFPDDLVTADKGPFSLEISAKEEAELQDLSDLVSELEARLIHVREAETKDMELEKELKDFYLQQERDRLETCSSDTDKDEQEQDSSKRASAAAERTKDVISRLRQVNRAQREENRMLKGETHKLHQSNCQLEEAVSEQLETMAEMEADGYVTELDQHKSLLQSLSSCQDCEEQYVAELAQKQLYLDFEVRIRDMYMETIQDIVTSTQSDCEDKEVVQFLEEIADQQRDYELHLHFESCRKAIDQFKLAHGLV